VRLCSQAANSVQFSVLINDSKPAPSSNEARLPIQCSLMIRVRHRPSIRSGYWLTRDLKAKVTHAGQSRKVLYACSTIFSTMSNGILVTRSAPIGNDGSARPSSSSSNPISDQLHQDTCSDSETMSLFGLLGAGSGSSTIRSPFMVLSHSLARLERIRSGLPPPQGRRTRTTSTRYCPSRSCG
jgi:hypothetical protein